MPYITPTANESGAYSAPQSNPAAGYIPLSDEQAQMVVEYNGFVTITETEEGVTVVPNTEAWEEWKAAQTADTPAPPTAEERLAALESAMLSLMGVTSNV